MPHVTTTPTTVGQWTQLLECTCGWLRYCHTADASIRKNDHLNASHRAELGRHDTGDRGPCATCKGEGMVEIEHEHADGSTSYTYTTCPRNCNN